MLNKYQANISHALIRLRKEFALQQTSLAKILGVTQSALSKIERGQGSISAEQLIALLRYFNLSVDYFVSAAGPTNHDDEKQNALIRFGANHLRSIPYLTPADEYNDIHVLILSVLIETTSARLITALAPVIVNNFQQISIKLLHNRFFNRGLEFRFFWLIENILTAVDLVIKQKNLTTSQKLIFKRVSRKLNLDFEFFKQLLLKRGDVDFNFQTADKEKVSKENFVDICKTLDRLESISVTIDVLNSRAEQAKRWNILTRIKLNDFYNALLQAHGLS